MWRRLQVAAGGPAVPLLGGAGLPPGAAIHAAYVDEVQARIYREIDRFDSRVSNVCFPDRRSGLVITIYPLSPQDWTEAELRLLLAVSADPNGLFLVRTSAHQSAYCCALACFAIIL